uniref:Kinesin motor domain-containing protein n=1 Tax=Strigamia maritima TaxID=126957 RepID=T1IMM0_STRMM
MVKLPGNELEKMLRGLGLVGQAIVKENRKQIQIAWKNSSLRPDLRKITENADRLTIEDYQEKVMKNVSETMMRSSMVYEGLKQFSTFVFQNARVSGMLNDSINRDATSTSGNNLDIESDILMEKQRETKKVEENEKIIRNKPIIDERKHQNELKTPKMVKIDVKKREEVKNTVKAIKFQSHQSLNEHAKESKVPSSRVGRLLSYGGLVAGLGLGAAAELTRRTLGYSEHKTKKANDFTTFLTEANAERIVNTLCRLRGAALKLGQMLSIQDNEMINPQLQKVFERVRQSADFMPKSQIEKVFKEEFGSDWREKVDKFEMKPFAAASIGQVHLATLKDGREVAVKIQYPGIAESVNSDISYLMSMMKYWNFLPQGLFVDNIVTVARRELGWEVDYEREAKCAKRYRSLLEDNPEFNVPKVIDELSTKQIFTSELVLGLPLDKCVELDQETRNFIAHSILRLCLKELYEFRFMQTDPNWSNFYYNPETKQLSLLDFGACRDFKKSFVDKYIRIIKGAADRDRKAVIHYSKEAKFLSGLETKVMESAHVDAVMILGEAFSQPISFNFATQDTTKRIQKILPIMLQHRLVAPPEESYSLHRKMAGLDQWRPSKSPFEFGRLTTGEMIDNSSIISLEREMGAEKIVDMDGKTTIITNNKITQSIQEGDSGRDREKAFCFDYSYWSFDNKDKNFISQEKVFNDLGTDVVHNAFEGYNACVFAYGQTGSGKTYTMMGDESSKGLIPRICQNLFERMEIHRGQTTYKTEVCYLEIYNEKVKDLLRPNFDSTKLRVREHPQLGPYVEGLSQHSVMDYNDINQLIETGNSFRTTASTKMNEDSSRSHAILTLTFVQATFSHDMPRETVSKINLVDLAGSERVDSSGAKGQRLVEGAHINKSLVTLGLVISNLAAQLKNRNVFIPYRNSVLTWLLKDSLGGNSKTIMIATISPADVNYHETLSTLRYAHTAKNIVNKPTINEDPNVRVIRELRAEIARLKSLLSTNKNGNSSIINELQANEEKVKLLTEKWAERWGETKSILEEQKTLALRKSGLGVILDSDRPHLVGIDDSLYSSGMTFYPLKEGETILGGETTSPQPDIVLTDDTSGSVCTIRLNGNEAVLYPMDISCCIDGLLVEEPEVLQHSCVIRIGRNIFRYNAPAEAAIMRESGIAESRRSRMSRLSFLSQSTPNLALKQSVSRLNLDEKKWLDKGISIQDLPQEISHLGDFISKHRNRTNQLNIQKRNAYDSKNVLNSPGKLMKSMDQIVQTETKLVKPEVLNQCDFACGDTSPKFSPRYTFSSPRQSEVALTLSEAFRNYHASISSEGADQTDELMSQLANMRQILEQSDKDLRSNSNCDIKNKLQQAQHIRDQFDLLQSKLNSVSCDALSPISNYSNVFSPTGCRSAFEYPNLSTVSLADYVMGGSEPNRENSLSSASSQFSFCIDKDDILSEHEMSVIIASFLIRGSGSSVHYEYEIQMTVKNESWTIYRRYNRFRELHYYMKQKYGNHIVKGLRIPSRWFWSRISDSSAERTRQQLEVYLNELLARCLSRKECHLYAYADCLSRDLLCKYIPFFLKGEFEGSKFTAG